MKVIECLLKVRKFEKEIVVYQIFQKKPKKKSIVSCLASKSDHTKKLKALYCTN